MEPKVWGPSGWFFMHSITLGYPANPTAYDKKNMKTFFTNVGHVLPCEKCKKNYYKHLKTHPLNDEVLSSKENLVKWLINIHNEVNKMTGKEIKTYEDVMKYYDKQYESSNNLLIVFASLGTLATFILVILLCMWFNKFS